MAPEEEPKLWGVYEEYSIVYDVSQYTNRSKYVVKHNQEKDIPFIILILKSKLWKSKSSAYKELKKMKMRELLNGNKE